MKNIVKIINFILISMIFFASSFINITNVKAAGEHEFSFVIYDCNQITDTLKDEVDTVKNRVTKAAEVVCLGPNGDKNVPELSPNADVEPGKIIKLAVYYKPGSLTDVGMQVKFFYNSEILSPIYLEKYNRSTREYTSTLAYDLSVDLQELYEDWGITASDTSEKINFMANDKNGSNGYTLEDELEMVYFYFKVKDTAPAGSALTFNFDTTSGSGTGMNNKSPVKTTDSTLNVYGEMSDNTALKTLTVSNESTNYEVSEFTPNSNTTKDYDVIVPNHITNVDINAEATDSNSTVASGIGNHTLNVGNNEIKMIVQAQNGSQDIYTINVYRLSNDASLKSLSLSNNVDIGDFSSTKTSYTSLVPYSTSTTTVSAQTTHKNAAIESGTGTFDLPNHGSIINSREIKVNAENCNTIYASVPDNICTNKIYKIDITRTSPSNNTNLSDLTINGETITGFLNSKAEYTLPNVENNIASLNLNAMVEDIGKAKIISNLGVKNLKVGDNALTIIVQAEDKTEKTYTINVRRLSNDSKLSSLNVTSDQPGTLSPTFSSTFYDYYTYSAPATATKVNVSAVVNDTLNATIISGTGEYNIDTTSNINVTVQAEDGSTSIYKIKIVRAKSSNNNLSSLSLDGYELNEEFSPSTTLYTANVSGEVESVSVSATVEDIGKAQIVSGLGNHNLNIGSNTIQVRVKAENNATKDYTITVNRAKKTVSSLTDLKVDNQTVKGFNETTIEYTLDKVPFTKTSVEISATKKDPDSKVSGLGTISLNTGLNKLYVTVVAQDNTTQTRYVINIEREKDSNAYLRDLQVNGTTIKDFNKETLDYNLTVENEVRSLDLNPIADGTNIGGISITGNSNFSTTSNNLVQITVTAENGNFKVYKINVTRKKSTNNYLKSIELSSGLLNPVFSKEQNDYKVDVERNITSINITPILEDSTSTVLVNGPSELVVGPNTFTITVTSESNVSNTYTIIVNRKASNNNYLSNLTIDGQTIENFNKEESLYTINVDSKKTSVVVGAQKEDPNAVVTGSGTYDLETGVNTISVVVTAEDGTPRTYSVVVNKSKSNDNLLSSLSVSGATLNPIFSKEVNNYSVNVAYSVTNTTISAVLSDPKAIVEGLGNKELNTGENTFDIVVTAEDNTKNTYRIVITRAKNNNANLSNIILSGGFNISPNFDPNTLEYDVNVPNSVSSLEITAYKQDPNAISVEGAGVVNLQTGVNNINIIVTAENGIAKKVYLLRIDRDKSNNADLKSITLSSGTLNPAFNKDKTKYEVIVPNEVENLIISAETFDSNAQAVIKNNENLKVGTNKVTITVTAEDGSLNVYEIDVLRQPSTNNFLSSISVKDLNDTEYIDAFVKTKLDYNITVENNIDRIIISGEKEDNTSTIKGVGEKTLEIGENSFEIGVTSNSGIERVYVVKVTRKANSNNFLSSLEVEGYTINPEFNKTKLSYTLTVPSSVNSVIINANAEVNTSSIVGTGPVNLQTGVNNFNIDVTSESGESKTYVIVITKEASNNNYLTSLTINPGTLTPSFNKDTLEYNVEVDNLTKVMEISAEKGHEAQTISGLGIKSLNVGMQTFNIDVKAENNETRTYKINVNREASSNKDLSDLKVNGQTIENFNKDELYYTLNVENSVDKINIEAIVLDDTAEATGDGEISLNTGENDINITVTAEDGTIKIYTIRVSRAKSSNNYLNELSVNEGILSPEFNKETLNYNITVPYEVEYLNINAIREVNTSSIEIDGNNNFVVGSDNKVYINVVAEDETVRTYAINVVRQQQVNNFLNDIVVTDNDGTRYSLSPEFNKSTLNYVVELSNKVNEVNISVTKGQSSLTVSGDGKVSITSFPQTHKIVVSTTGGLERTYSIEFTKGLSTNKYLENIAVNKGTLTPVFNKYETAYNVDLYQEESEITITTTKAEEAQTVIGDGVKQLVKGRNQFKITVTSESGETNIYNIFVNVNVLDDDENKLDSITVNKGTLTPEFNKNIKDYTVDLIDEDEITVEATGKNEIIGTGTYPLTEGSNIIEIITKDEDGNENIYRIVVNKGTIINPYLSQLSVENYKLQEEFNKELYNYNLRLDNLVPELNVIAIPESKTATVTIVGNENLNIGNNIISISVTDKNGGQKVYTINVYIGQNKITSNIHKIEESYIKTINEKRTSVDIKNEMTNPIENLKIYDLNSNEINDTDMVATGYTIKLIINGVESDSKTLIIKGDINSDGEVAVSDIIKFRLYILQTVQFSANELYASDVNDDDSSEVSDLIQIRRHILGNLNLYAKEDK